MHWPDDDVISDTAGQTTPNILEANVTGNIPLLQDFNELGIGHPITMPDGSSVTGVVLPDDWATLAPSRLATVQGPLSDPSLVLGYARRHGCDRGPCPGVAGRVWRRA